MKRSRLGRRKLIMYALIKDEHELFSTVYRTAGVTGNIMVNSTVRNVTEFRRLSAYIMQNDNLQPLLTVQEAMNVAAELKLTVSHRQKRQKV